jgi:sterol 3beta-glucosyltransferase
LPLKDIESVNKETGYRFGYYGMVVVVRGHEEIFFDFPDVQLRDDCVVTLILSQQAVQQQMRDSGLLDEDEERMAEVAKAEHQALLEARQDSHGDHAAIMPAHISHIGTELLLSHLDIADSLEAADSPPIHFDDPRASIINFKPTESLRITCLTIGSRGDVQPYIALCKGLLKEGHKPRIATHNEFGSWIESHGIEFRPVSGDPAELMRICVENGMFTYSFMREASSKVSFPYYTTHTVLKYKSSEAGLMV